MNLFRRPLGQVLVLLLLLLGAGAPMADEALKPFVLGSRSSGDLKAKLAESRKSLEGQSFEVVGEYSPYANTYVIVVTSDALKQAAAKSERGG